MPYCAEELINKFNIYNSESPRRDMIPFVENEPMRNHSTFKIGGDARIFASPTSDEALAYSIKSAKECGVPYYILGHGSNVLFDDAGYGGVIISTDGIRGTIIDGEMLYARCGTMLSTVAGAARDASLSGMEALFGIPGTVGGAVYMNAGAYGSEMSNIVVSTKYFDIDTMSFKTVHGDDHHFGYRESVFREMNSVILSTQLKLVADNKDDINDRMAEYRRRRIERQPLEYPSAGSTFKRYPGRYTGQMIEEAGLKGLSVGGAAVSEKHAGFIINKGNATSADVKTLIETIKAKIYENYGINIETEVIFVGSGTK